MGIMDDNPVKEPLHYGEVYSMWTYLLAAKAMVAGHQTHLNHASDEDLCKLLEESIKMGKEQSKQLEKVLKDNGVGLPPAPPERPKANHEEIPVGARFQDMEIAAALSVEISAGLVTCSTIMGQTIREDIALIFGRFHTEKAALGAKSLRLNKDKGWLVPPPLHQGYKEQNN